MKTLKCTIYIPRKLADTIDRYLNVPENASPDECLGEDETISVTGTFEDGKQVDIKCCGVQYRTGECNCAWSEAVLFNADGKELVCTEPSDGFLGTWELEHDDKVYACTVLLLENMK